MGSFDKPFTFDRVVRIVITLLIFFALFYFVKSVKGALLPFFVAWLFAYMIHPIVLWVKNKLRLNGKFIPILIVLTFLTAVIAGTLWLAIPSLIDESQKILAAANDFFTKRKYIDAIPLAWQQYLADHLNLEDIISDMSAQDMENIISRVLRGIWGVVSDSWAVIMALLTFFIILIYIVFILLDYDRISKGALELVPYRYRHVVSTVAGDVQTAMNRYFRGQAVVAGTVGILLAIGFKIVGVPMGILLGLFMGLLNMVPYLQLAGIVPLLFLCLLKNVETGMNFWVILALSILVMVIVQAIEDLFLTPKVMGKVMGMNPAIILLSLSIWGTLLGILGMIIALPLTTLLLSYYERFIANFDDKNNTNSNLK